MQTLHNYDSKDIISISEGAKDLSSDEEKKEVENKNKDNKNLLDDMKKYINDVTNVVFTNKLSKNPVCLSSEGDITIDMEKVINAMPTDQKVNAQKVLEINMNHPIAEKLIKLENDGEKEEVEKLSKILYTQARLIEGLPIDNPTEITNLICDELTK